jgi:hypothetical protein
MGRGRGKGKKSSVNNNEDTLSGEEEKIPAQKRRGRPQKPLKDNDIEEEELVKKLKLEEEEGLENGKTDAIDAENGKKRRRNNLVTKERTESVKEENGNGMTTDDSTKSNGYRLNGSRRKNKPRRAAEAGVECR